ncbi:DNA/RNA non-specific endonuclease, partial [Paenibacillus massiliensis]|uniref:DNA/RNA non-specific endonuclease n=1 Tax=Paenibacillus massiliensis TaxID=225917 RepID=UPI001CF79D14
NGRPRWEFEDYSRMDSNGRGGSGGGPDKPPKNHHEDERKRREDEERRRKDEEAEGTGKDSKTVIPYGQQIEKVGNKKILKPNAKYTTPQGYTYETNEFGRIESVEADLQLGKGTRNQYAQSNVGETDRIRGDYPDRDDGGHLIGSQFKGSGDIDNLVPMNSQINEAGGKWHQMEKEWASALERKESVKVKINPQYTGNSARPDSFIVEYSIDDGRTKKITIENQIGG